MPELVTLGESMIILNPEFHGPLRHADRLRMSVGGAESNVAIGVARLGRPAGWISRLGDDELGLRIVQVVRGEGVDVSQVRMVPGLPTGLILKELRADRDPGVFYYRKGSAASTLSPDDLDPAYFTGVRIVHVTGITPLLSDSCRAAVLRAVALARGAGALVSFDPNVRRKLWRPGAAEMLLEVARQADLVLAGADEGELLLGATGPEAVAAGFLELGARVCVVKLGARGALVAERGAAPLPVPACPVARVVDTVGAGDAFAAGFLAGWLDGHDLAECTARACYAGAAAVQVVGDYEGLPTRPEMEAARSGRGPVDR